MNLKRNKADKADAKMISLYGKTQTIELWKFIESSLSESKYVYQMEQYITIRASLKNKLDGLKSKKEANYLIKSIDSQIDELTIN